MSGCVLRVSFSTELDLDAVLEWFPVEPLAVFRRGQLPRPTAKRVSEHSGFNTLVSDHGGEHLRDQVADAQVFLDYHRDALVRLGQYDARVSIDFATHFPSGAAARTHELPTELLWLCGELAVSIAVSVYRTNESSE